MASPRPLPLSQAQQLFPLLLAQLFAEITRQGYGVTLGEAWRPQWVQDAYVQQGKSQTKKSNHTKRLAIDLNLFRDGTYLSTTEDYASIGAYWATLHPNAVWGGSWTTLKDGTHFELRGW